MSHRNAIFTTAGIFGLALGLAVEGTAPALAQSAEEAAVAKRNDAGFIAENITIDRFEDGKYLTTEDIPTYKVQEDGTIDWLSYSGFRRYHSECHVCHGPEGEGSTYAPALKFSALNMDYYAFQEVVVNGIEKVSNVENSVMPAFGDNPNVMCYFDDIYVYLKARGMGAIPRGRPKGREDKSDAIREAEKLCLGR